MVELRFIRNREEQQKILHACHRDPTSGHMALKRTLARISERFMWNGMVKDVKDMVSTSSFYMSHFNIVKKLFVHITYASIILLQISHCDTCQKMNRKMTTTRPELHPIPVKSPPWHHVGVDFIGPLLSSSSNVVYILTLSDYFTK